MQSNNYSSNQYPSHQYTPYNQYPQMQPQNTPEPILVGVPITQGQIANSYPPSYQNSIPYPDIQQGHQQQQQRQQLNNNFSHPLQLPSSHYQQISLPHSYQLYDPQNTGPQGTFNHGKNHNMNLVRQNQGYAELQEQETGENRKYPDLAQYHQGEDAMVSNNVQFRPLEVEKFTPVVYNTAILYQINSREPQLALCRNCNKYVQTIVKYEVGVGTMISGGFLACLGAIPCAFIPCCMKDLKDAVHFCPVCGDELGKKKFIVN